MATKSEPDPYLKLLRRQIDRTNLLSDTHLGCRRGALGHNWEPVKPDHEAKVRGAVAVAFQCSRCDAIKRGIVSKRYGEWLAKPIIEYPEGYLLVKDPNEKGPQMSAQAVRAAFVARVQASIDALPPMRDLG